MKRILFTAVGLILCLILTLLVFRLPVVDSLTQIAQGAFGDKFGVSRTLVKSIPLVLCGLGIGLAWRGGMYNIGGEGQFVIGGVCGAWLARGLIANPSGLGSYGILIAAALGGAGYAALAGFLSVKRGVNVVISTILLNFIALQLLGWVTSGPLQEAKHGLPQTDALPDALMLARFDRQTDLHSGIFLAFALIFVVQVFLFGTKWGYGLRLVGSAPRAARAAKINIDRSQIGAMALSGALCGLAGGIQYVGVSGQIGPSFSQNWGFLAIPVALLGNLHPLGIGLSALYFGALFAGSDQLARFNPAGPTLVYVIQGVAVLAFLAFVGVRFKPSAVVEAE